VAVAAFFYRRHRRDLAPRPVETAVVGVDRLGVLAALAVPGRRRDMAALGMTTTTTMTTTECTTRAAFGVSRPGTAIANHNTSTADCSAVALRWCLRQSSRVELPMKRRDSARVTESRSTCHVDRQLTCQWYVLCGRVGVAPDGLAELPQSRAHALHNGRLCRRHVVVLRPVAVRPVADVVQATGALGAVLRVSIQSVAVAGRVGVRGPRPARRGGLACDELPVALAASEATATVSERLSANVVGTLRDQRPKGGA
jgi:hypothetical protein